MIAMIDSSTFRRCGAFLAALLVAGIIGAGCGGASTEGGGTTSVAPSTPVMDAGLDH